MKKILIKGYYGYHNLGDDFILYSLLKSLDRAAKLEAGVKESYQVSVISNGDDYQELFKKFHNISCKIIPERKFRKLHKRIELIKCDYWIIGGGGLFRMKMRRIFRAFLVAFNLQRNSMQKFAYTV